MTFKITRFFQLIVFLGIGILFLQSCTTDSIEKPKPNVIVILTDDQGWGDLGVNGNPHVYTPNIDQLAKRGVHFIRFYVSPVCSPTRAEILTGRYHPRGGIYSTSEGGERLDLDEKTIADIFQSNGYKTAAFGKWHNGSQPPYHPTNRGFEEFYGFTSGHWGNYFSPMLEKNGEVTKGKGFIVDDLTDHAMDFIEKSSDQPFFVFLAFNTPHSPMQVPDVWWDKYKDAPIDSTHRYADEEITDKTRAAYALCENIDWNVGKVMGNLERLGKLDNTIVIYMSDNGPNGWRWNDGLKGIKGSTDEGGVRSPFIVFWKDQLQPKIISQIASAIDILPSLMDLAGITNPFDKQLDGRSLKPLLVGADAEWKDRLVYSQWNGNVSVRNQQHLLDKDNQLFDLSIDPEQKNPIAEPSQKVKLELVNAKEEWIKSVLSELDRNREEIFPVGYKESKYTLLPARDGLPHGNIKRSSRHPNSSFFTNWTATTDSVTWGTDILTAGKYKATIYYTCKESAVGSALLLKHRGNELKAIISKAHDSGFVGIEYDRVVRDESYEKDFIPMELGVIQLEKGRHPLTMMASQIKGQDFIDLRLLVLERLE
ncbi:arylsulfatase A-like enzyme [Algoriphagus ratkowskyi]|uniref:Arylsulfatase n=1 Tax=Algoriphagus ratkowskyi TaxID=57028 RepID=A0A2W7RAM6_9BACT|nr:arylsulfatase [Algoriphagus ratkowskyi]PZX51259.1 arylsulfatase A-like enzyme [Algoriphagus ratkowskyi]TXD75949.1 arylsulfatase [Algoriphagus ratkowskyi]